VSMSMSRKSLAVGSIAASLLTPVFARAAEAENLEEVREEVRQLRAQVQAVRGVLIELVESDRQRGPLLARALKAMGAGSADLPPPGAPAARGEVVAASASAARPAAPDSPAAPPRRRTEGAPARRIPRPEPLATGTVRGKVSVPSNEPAAYIYVENVVARPAKGQRVVIEQSRKTFVPSWVVVQRGTTVAFPNSDTIFHNVFSLSPGNSFDLGLYSSAATAKSHTFNEPGPVDVYCNIHPQMAASVLVVPNRYFAKVKANGSFEISNVPVGKRKLVAWAPGSRLTAEWVEVTADATAETTLKLEPKSPRHENKSGQPYGSYE